MENLHSGLNTTFCGFSMGRNQYWAGRVYNLCVYYMTRTPEGSTDLTPERDTGYFLTQH